MRLMSNNLLSVPRIRNVYTEQCILHRGAVKSEINPMKFLSAILKIPSWLKSRNFLFY